MLSLLWLVPAFCLAGFLVLALVGGRLSRPAVAWIGVGSLALSTLAAFLTAAGFFTGAPPVGAMQRVGATQTRRRQSRRRRKEKPRGPTMARAGA